MILDKKLAGLLSNFFLDISKAFFVATFVTPSLSVTTVWWEILWILIKGLMNAILFLVAAWQFKKLEDR